VATVVELDLQIAEKENELAPLVQSASDAQEQCLQQFATALGPIIAAHARGTVVDGGVETERLQADGRLVRLRSEVQALDADAIVRKCLVAAPVWTHLRLPMPASGMRGTFTPDTQEPPGRLDYGWGDLLDCLSNPLEGLLQRYGYQHPYMHLRMRGWPEPLWDALSQYAEAAKPFVDVTRQLDALKTERAKLAAADAWDKTE